MFDPVWYIVLSSNPHTSQLPGLGAAARRAGRYTGPNLRRDSVIMVGKAD